MLYPNSRCAYLPLEKVYAGEKKNKNKTSLRYCIPRHNNILFALGRRISDKKIKVFATPTHNTCVLFAPIEF